MRDGYLWNPEIVKRTSKRGIQSGKKKIGDSGRHDAGRREGLASRVKNPVINKQIYSKK